MDAQQAIEDLEARLERYPVERYPVQHATAQFHLGTTLTGLGRLDEAAQALHSAAELFDPQRLPAEHAKATNAQGAVFRQTGALPDAAAAFDRAAEMFGRASLPTEQGAALFNLGLVRRDQGDTAASAESFRAARDRFDPEQVPAEAAAAGRELAATLLVDGELPAATEALERAMPLAERGNDLAGYGACANLLGLVHLGANRPADARDAFADALGAHPRSVRPGEHAMAKANLALAHERAGSTDHAYLNAVQALGTPGAADAVREQASGVLDRVGQRRGAVLGVLDREPSERWPAIVREEFARWVDADPDERRAECGGWVDGQLARPTADTGLAETWIGALLELPPDAMRTVIRGTLDALERRDTESVEAFQFSFSRAVVHFPIPQWMRCKDIVNEVASELGQEPSWG